MPKREGAPVTLAWECLSNLDDEQRFSARLRLHNASGTPIGAGWALYFNSCRRILPWTVDGGFAIVHVNGDLFRLTRSAQEDWAPGRDYALRYQARFWAISITDAPLGFYLVTAAGQAIDLGDPAIAPFVQPCQLLRHAHDLVPAADAAWRYRENAALALLPPHAVGRVTPRPLEARFDEDARRVILRSGTPLVVRGDAAALAGEIALLRALLGGLPAGADDEDGAAAHIVLECGPVAAPGAEAYLLEIGAGPGGRAQVLLRGASAHGVFNGLQTLAQLLEDDGALPAGRVLDAPRFGYRGLMLDVARHFVGVDTVLRLVDCMACYKLNRLHLHLTDDEGWRLHIDALPELTAIGARRGVPGADEAPCLPPSFGSGAAVAGSAGTGYYGRADFIAILRYANARHIEVIPEFNLPGHARAAVVAMRARHDRLLAQGDAQGAARYRLDDPDDASAYESVQMWRDNVVCIALPSVDRFIETVVAHVAALYRAAGVPLWTIHTGGDEVPAGAWTASPRCRALMRERGWDTVGRLHADFVARCRAILARHGIACAGWEETALVHAGGTTAMPAPPGGHGPGVQVYAWNNAWGSGQEDLAYRLANAGHDVVLANAASLYFDLAHAKDPHEPGYYWAGFVDTRDTFAFRPFAMLDAAAADPMGRPVAPARRAALQRLDAAGRAHIRGLQGQLWGENAGSPARIEYLAAPRLLALAERAWAPDPGWDGIADPAARAAAIGAAWNEFANRLGQRELARLDRAPLDWAYRLPPPGVLCEAAGDATIVHANAAFPGLALHYTVDGSAPRADGPRYRAPLTLAAGAVLKVASFDTRGRASRVVTIDNRMSHHEERHGRDHNGAGGA
ncbi:family 20 glycosylhydrolase [Massilia forsythiae]|uniref:beta-N-acetylhexosaminidase n=1 Tax=Massilia forsythiae TaxID=2728020 RepID=A0A7Z2VV72_9BURK|nr:family 20 glycosylhydrolase [Massilia forsythiae]QJD99509.1 family 20 glycosylhydrolase [Massilia forsythiae]